MRTTTILLVVLDLVASRYASGSLRGASALQFVSVGSDVKVPLFQVSAFSSRQFGGNPAAVVIVDKWPEVRVMQAIANENQLPETAFVIPSAGACPLRWFTPKVEVDLCGHATLGTAHVLLRHYFPSRERVSFLTRSGQLEVLQRGDQLVLDFPARPGTGFEPTPALVSALGRQPREALRSRDILAILDTEEEVRAFRPDAQRISQLDAFALIVSAPGEKVDFVSRFFAPNAGIFEDPATGSAHCTLVPYWAGRLRRHQLQSRQLSARQGEFTCELAGDRVLLGGSCRDYLRGELTLDPSLVEPSSGAPENSQPPLA